MKQNLFSLFNSNIGSNYVKRIEKHGPNMMFTRFVVYMHFRKISKGDKKSECNGYCRTLAIIFKFQKEIRSIH